MEPGVFCVWGKFVNGKVRRVTRIAISKKFCGPQGSLGITTLFK